MQTYEYDGVPPGSPRSHPWTDSERNSSWRYYDLKADPSLVRTSLEDFVPWARYPAVGVFYDLLEWINGPGSLLESNDCAFDPPQPGDHDSVRGKFECSGRLMVLYRNLPLNIDRRGHETLKGELHHSLAPMDESFRGGAVGTTIVPVRYITLPGRAQQQLGAQLMISFWAWGDSEEETMTNLRRVFENLSRALHQIVRAPSSS